MCFRINIIIQSHVQSTSMGRQSCVLNVSPELIPFIELNEREFETASVRSNATGIGYACGGERLFALN